MTNEPNPYAAPLAETVHAQVKIGKIPERDLAKIGAIIKDAGQFWLAIILCILCSLLGAAIIPIWYGIRLVQWSNMSKKYPGLLTPNSPPKSLPSQFQSAQWKLWVGLGVGFVLAILIFGTLAFSFLVSATETIQ